MGGTALMEQVDQFKVIEKHLKNYHTYKTGLANMKKQLEFYFPKITTSYEAREGSTGTFMFHSGTEEFGLKRIEKAQRIEREIEKYGWIIESIESALQLLEPLEKEFVVKRYFKGWSVRKVSIEFGYSLRNIYVIREEAKKKLMISLNNLIIEDH